MVQEVLNDSQIVLKTKLDADSMKLLSAKDESGNYIGLEYKLTPVIDQSKMFSSVVTRLSKGMAVGIFPEGGSHDRPEMLPLQAGVAIMALETLSKYPGCKIRIVPVGLHYFNADKVYALN